MQNTVVGKGTELDEDAWIGMEEAAQHEGLVGTITMGKQTRRRKRGHSNSG